MRQPTLQILIPILLLLVLHAKPSSAELQRPQPGLDNLHRHSNILKDEKGSGKNAKQEQQEQQQQEEPLDLWSGSSLTAKELAERARAKVRKDWHWDEQKTDGENQDGIRRKGNRDSARVAEVRPASSAQGGQVEKKIKLEETRDDHQQQRPGFIQSVPAEKETIVVASPEKQQTRPTLIQTVPAVERKSISSSPSQDSDSDSSIKIAKSRSLVKYTWDSSSSILRFNLRCFRYLLSVVTASISKGYELTMAYFFRPLFILLSPLYYVLSGFYFILVLLPFSFIKAIVKEIYPLYIFFGVAAILGGAIGIGSATVLWIGSLIFKDNENDKNDGDDDGHDEKGSSQGQRRANRKSSRSKSRKKESVLTRSIREKKEMEENRAKRRAKGLRELKGKLNDLEDMELNDGEYLEGEDSDGEFSEESDDWLKRRGKSTSSNFQRLEEPESESSGMERDDNEDYFPNGILKTSNEDEKPGGKASNKHQDQSSSSLRLNLNSNQTSSHHFGQPQSSQHLPKGATSRGGWNHSSNSTTPNASASSSPLATPIASKNFYSKGLIGNHPNSQQSLSDYLYPPSQSGSRNSTSPMNSPDASRFSGGGRRRNLNQSA